MEFEKCIAYFCLLNICSTFTQFSQLLTSVQALYACYVIHMYLSLIYNLCSHWWISLVCVSRVVPNSPHPLSSFSCGKWMLSSQRLTGSGIVYVHVCLLHKMMCFYRICSSYSRFKHDEKNSANAERRSAEIIHHVNTLNGAEYIHSNLSVEHQIEERVQFCEHWNP